MLIQHLTYGTITVVLHYYIVLLGSSKQFSVLFGRGVFAVALKSSMLCYRIKYTGKITLAYFLVQRGASQFIYVTLAYFARHILLPQKLAQVVKTQNFAPDSSPQPSCQSSAFCKTCTCLRHFCLVKRARMKTQYSLGLSALVHFNSSRAARGNT